MNIVEPGRISNHLHKVFGGSNFYMSSATAAPVDVYNQMFASSCTTCDITIDKSAYWVADLVCYFKITILFLMSIL